MNTARTTGKKAFARKGLCVNTPPNTPTGGLRIVARPPYTSRAAMLARALRERRAEVADHLAQRPE